MNIHRKEMLSSAASLMDSGDYSDLTIVCEGHQFRVHKALVCPASPVIAAELKHNTQERATNIIENKTFDLDTMRHMISYIYKRNYTVFETAAQDGESDIDSDSGDGDNETESVTTKIALEQAETAHGDKQLHEHLAKLALNIAKNPDKTTAPPTASREFTIGDINAFFLTHARVYAIADYYQIDKLKKLAVKRFENVETYTCIPFCAEGFIEVVAQICQTSITTEDRLMEALLNVSIKQYKLLFNCPDFVNALHERPDCQGFLVQLAQKYAESREKANSLMEQTMTAFGAREVERELNDAEVSHSKLQQNRNISTLEYKLNRIWEGFRDLPGHCAGCRGILGVSQI